MSFFFFLSSLFRFWKFPSLFLERTWAGPPVPHSLAVAFVMQPYSLFETGWWDLAYWSEWVRCVSRWTLTRMPRVTPCEDVAGSEVWVWVVWVRERERRVQPAACASGRGSWGEGSDRGIITPHPRLHPTLLPFPSPLPSSLETIPHPFHHRASLGSPLSDS